MRAARDAEKPFWTFHRRSARQPRSARRAWPLLCLIAVLGGLIPAPAAEFPPIVLGVLALRGEPLAVERWSATAAYLGERIPDQEFRIRPLDFDQIDEAVRRHQVDFLLANSSIYVTMEAKYRISRIVTLKRRFGREPPTAIFGGVLFARADRADLRRPEDLRGRRLAAVDATSLGGWRMAWALLRESGIDPGRDLAVVRFLGTHDAVVLAVLAGQADAGTVRTGVIESMVAEGQLASGALKLLHRHSCAGLEWLNSTRCYPEWPLAKLEATPDAIANRVAIALIDMPEDHPALRAARIHGWAIPQNYQPVHELLRALQLPPYDREPEMTPTQFAHRHWPWLLGLLLGLLLILGVTFYVAHLSRRLYTSRARIQQSYLELQRMQQCLVEAEKMASLGSLVAGVSHEINTPVGMALTGITHLQDQRAELERSYRAAAMTEEEFQDFLAQNREMQAAIRHNLERAAALVRSFKQVAVDRSTEERRRFRMRDYVEEILLSLRNRLKQTRLDIALDIDEALWVDSYPGAFSQILTNLLVNSLVHAYAPRDQGQIRIRIWRQAGRLFLHYSDDGKGIPVADQARIFEPFFTTNREAGGSGLGLNIVYNIVIQRLHGRIDCQSQPGKGVRFSIDFPDLESEPSP